MRIAISLTNLPTKQFENRMAVASPRLTSLSNFHCAALSPTKTRPWRCLPSPKLLKWEGATSARRPDLSGRVLCLRVGASLVSKGQNSDSSEIQDNVQKDGAQGEPTNIRSKATWQSNSPRHFVVVCHNTSELAARGQFDPLNLLDGRVDVWCRVISNALYFSEGIRKNVRVWLILQSAGKSIEVDGARVTTLKPDEKTIALQLQQALQNASIPELLPTSRTANNRLLKSERNARLHHEKWLRRQPGQRGPIPGIKIHDNDCLDYRLKALRHESGGPLKMLLLNEDGDKLINPFVQFGTASDPLFDGESISNKKGAKTNEKVSGESKSNEKRNGSKGEFVVVLGDSYGMTVEEVSFVKQQMGASSVTLGRLPLLASQCIVLINHHLDS